MSEATSTDDTIEARLAQFAVQLNETTAQLRKVEEERDEYRKLVLHLKEENERLRRGLLGQKAERLPRNDAQLSLAILGMAMAGANGSSEAEAAAAAIEKQLVKQHTRCKPVRKPLPAELPRVEIEIVPPEVEREPDAFECIGSETREVLLLAWKTTRTGSRRDCYLGSLRCRAKGRPRPRSQTPLTLAKFPRKIPCPGTRLAQGRNPARHARTFGRCRRP